MNGTAKLKTEKKNTPNMKSFKSKFENETKSKTIKSESDEMIISSKFYLNEIYSNCVRHYLQRNKTKMDNTNVCTKPYEQTQFCFCFLFFSRCAGHNVEFEFRIIIIMR